MSLLFLNFLSCHPSLSLGHDEVLLECRKHFFPWIEENQFVILQPSHDINDGHFVSECPTHAMMRHNFTGKHFGESCDGGGEELWVWNRYSTPQQVCTNCSDLIAGSPSQPLFDGSLCMSMHTMWHRTVFTG